jgi:hypothetical protein
MEQRNSFGRRGSNPSPSAPVSVASTQGKKKPNVVLIAVAAVVGFGLVGWIAKQVAPEQTSAPQLRSPRQPLQTRQHHLPLALERCG